MTGDRVLTTCLAGDSELTTCPAGESELTTCPAGDRANVAGEGAITQFARR